MPAPAELLSRPAPASPPAPAPVAEEAAPLRYRGREFGGRKAYFHGCQRVIAPAETLRRIRPVFGRIGLVRLADVTGLDRIGIPTVLSIRPAAANLSVDSGKGFTLDAAMVSASMECIERFHGETVELPETVGSYDEVAERHAMVPLDRLPLTRATIFHRRLKERWTPGWDLVGQRDVAVPVSLVTMQRFTSPRAAPVCFPSNSNGLASGNTFAEAVTAGLLEVMERDALACWKMAQSRGTRRMPRVRLETVEHPLVLDLLDRLDRVGVTPILFDCAVDTDIPVYMAVLYDREVRHIGMYSGYGAHLDPEIAMVRALTEAVQSRLVFVAGSRDDFFRHDYMRLKQGDNQASVSSLEEGTGTVDARDRRSLATPTFEGDVRVLLDRLAAVGLDQAITLDLTMPGFDVSVVRTIVPGLEGYVNDYYAPGARARAFSQGA
jgi:ribosomal protein S12 methylthiotransferase accessory factor